MRISDWSSDVCSSDLESGKFVIDSVWKEDGGKRRVARELANAAAGTLNDVVTFIGADLQNGDEIEGGSYGMRGKRFVYWEDGIKSDNRIKFKAAEDLIEYGATKAIQQ